MCTATNTGSAKATLLASVSYDASVRFWDPSALCPIGDPVTGHHGAVLAGCTLFGAGPDEATSLASAGADGAVLVWQLPPTPSLMAVPAAATG